MSARTRLRLKRLKKRFAEARARIAWGWRYLQHTVNFALEIMDGHFCSHQRTHSRKTHRRRTIHRQRLTTTAMKSTTRRSGDSKAPFQQRGLDLFTDCPLCFKQELMLREAGLLTQWEHGQYDADWVKGLFRQAGT